MNWKKISATLCVLSILTTIYLLIYSPDVLLREFLSIEQLPFGTILVWIGLIAFGLLFLILYPNRQKAKIKRFLFRILQFNVLLALFWGIISFLLSGNWANNFSGGYQYKVWIYYTGALIALPMFVYLLLFLRFVYLKIK